MGILEFFTKKRPRVNPETQRRENLMRGGRITDGTILEGEDGDDSRVVYYFYSVQGVDYESSEILNEQQLRNSIKYAPGAKIGVRYDPKNHGNSMLV